MARWNFMPPESISTSFFMTLVGVATVIGIEGYPPPNDSPPPKKKIRPYFFGILKVTTIIPFLLRPY